MEVKLGKTKTLADMLLDEANKSRERSDRLEGLILQMDSKYDIDTNFMKKELAAATVQRKELQLDLAAATEQLEAAAEERQELMEKVEAEHELVEVIAEKLDIAVDDRVVRNQDDKKIEAAILVKLDGNDQNDRRYYVLRRQRKYMNRGLSNLRAKNRSMRIVHKVDPTPNSVVLFNHMRERWPQIKPKRNTFVLPDNVSEADIIDIMNDLHNERKVVEVPTLDD